MHFNYDKYTERTLNSSDNFIPQQVPSEITNRSIYNPKNQNVILDGTRGEDLERPVTINHLRNNISTTLNKRGAILVKDYIQTT